MNKNLLVYVMVMVVIAFGINGCATKQYVDEQVNTKIHSIQTEMKNKLSNIDEVQKDISAIHEEIKTLKEQRMPMGGVSAQEAISRAEGKLAHGKLLYEVTFSDESVFFGFKSSQLSLDAKAALDVFAKNLIAENKDVFIEIQGHTDDIGSDEFNLKLGEERAEAVMRYLHIEHDLPLNRMSTFSYGKTRPVKENNSKENRAKNRRVILMVME